MLIDADVIHGVIARLLAHPFVEAKTPESLKEDVLAGLQDFAERELRLEVQYITMMALACKAMGGTGATVKCVTNGQMVTIFVAHGDLLVEVGDITRHNKEEKGKGFHFGVQMNLTHEAINAMDIKFFKCPIHADASTVPTDS